METLKTIEERASALEGRARKFRTQVVSLAKWIRDIMRKTADLFGVNPEPLDGFEAMLSSLDFTEERASLSARFGLAKVCISMESMYIDTIAVWARLLDIGFSSLASKQPILGKPAPYTDFGNIPTIQDFDSDEELSAKVSVFEDACDGLQSRIATLTEEIQAVHFRAAGFFGIDPSLFFSFQPTAHEIAEIEAKTGRRLFPPKQRRGFLGWIVRVFGKGKS